MARNEYDQVQDRLNRWHKAYELVQEQANCGGLWFTTNDVTIVFLQQELRRLHAVIEGEQQTLNREEQ